MCIYIRTIILCYITLCYIILYYIILCYYVILFYIILYCIILCYVLSKLNMINFHHYHTFWIFLTDSIDVAWPNRLEMVLPLIHPGASRSTWSAGELLKDDLFFAFRCQKELKRFSSWLKRWCFFFGCKFRKMFFFLRNFFAVWMTPEFLDKQALNWN